LGESRLALEPDRHARLESHRITFRIEAQAERAAIVIADRALGLPRRE
jgi:hypothetical protein